MLRAITGPIVDVFVAPECAVTVGAEDDAAIRPTAQYGQYVSFRSQGARVNTSNQAIAHVDTLRFAPVGTLVGRPGDQQRRAVRGGHALWTADVDGDGADEIVFGHSDTPQVHGVQVYDAVDATGAKWQKHLVDAGGMATEDLIAADVTGDGRVDIIAGGRATHNVKLYIHSN